MEVYQAYENLLYVRVTELIADASLATVERLKAGDWKGFGTQFDAMRELLEEMNRRSTGH